MAKLERAITGNFDMVLRLIVNGILGGSVSASLEGASDWRTDDARCAVRVFERYSWAGGNRLSLSVTLFGTGDSLHLSAITAGGSQAVFFKLNTFGEQAFLDKIEEILRRL